MYVFLNVSVCAINLYIIVGVYVCGREEESGRERTERCWREKERERERKRERGRAREGGMSLLA